MAALATELLMCRTLSNRLHGGARQRMQFEDGVARMVTTMEGGSALRRSLATTTHEKLGSERAKNKERADVCRKRNERCITSAPNAFCAVKYSIQRRSHVDGKTAALQLANPVYRLPESFECDIRSHATIIIAILALNDRFLNPNSSHVGRSNPLGLLPLSKPTLSASRVTGLLHHIVSSPNPLHHAFCVRASLGCRRLGRMRHPRGLVTGP